MYHYNHRVLLLVVTLLAASPTLVAHQSVGGNVLDGAAALLAQRFRKLDVTRVEVGQDGSPLTKLDGFAAALEASPAPVAMLELSSADVGAQTDVDALFAVIKKRLEALASKHPSTRIIVWTIGLSTVGRGLQGVIRNKMASGAFGERENVKRHQLNVLLRKEYAGRLFDLAAVQSKGCSFEREKETWPCLREDFTDDGAHLNTAGRKAAGRALLQVLGQ